MNPTQLSNGDGVDKDAPSSPPRRDFLRAGAVLAAALALPAAAALAQTSERWVATWGTAPAGPQPSSATTILSNQTLRLIVHGSVGGSRARIRISNEMGSSGLSIGAARIALRSSGAALVAGTDRQLLFGGRSAVSVPAGASVLSDAVSLNVPPFADLAVSLYLPGSTPLSTQHPSALQTNYVSTAGNQAANASLTVSRTFQIWPFLIELSVSGAWSGLSAANAVVAFGDSITDGYNSGANVNRRWPDYLARRLQLALGVAGNIGVVNRGISSNSLLKDYPNAMLASQRSLLRFNRDVLGSSGVRWVINLIGINDILYSSATNPIPAENLIEGHLQLVSRARSSGAYDAVVDFDLVLRDPGRPTRLLPTYDSGDHLHPNPTGYQAMAQAVPLTLFT